VRTFGLWVAFILVEESLRDSVYMWVICPREKENAIGFFSFVFFLKTYVK
jgi:hypothetical protein